MWESRTGVNTMAIVELACDYLHYLGEPQAAAKLSKVYQTGQNDEYNTPNYAPIENQSVRDTYSEWGCLEWVGAIISLIIIMNIFQQCNQQYQTPQYQSPPPPQFRPL